MSRTITLSTLGPHSPDYTREVAWAMAECVRVLNYAAGSGAETAIAYPATVYEVLGALSTATARMPQLLSQLTTWLERAVEAGTLADDRHRGPAAAVARSREAAARAKVALGSVMTALETAQQEIAFLRAADGKENEGGPW
jgi:hypothetical protein